MFFFISFTMQKYEMNLYRKRFEIILNKFNVLTRSGAIRAQYFDEHFRKVDILQRESFFEQGGYRVG